MPLEIRELHIKAVVSTEPTRSGAAPSAAAPKEENREALVAECVDQVLAVLREKAER